jgi:riboflavin synthase
MFTGLIEAVGEISGVKPMPGGLRLRVSTPLAGELTAGESIAVNGVCLTVVAADSDGFHADIGPETVRVTSFGTVRRGLPVNLERPLRADARLGGHFVQGHVDAVGTLQEIRHDGESHWLTVAYPEDVAPYLVCKGSIALDGISLTVAGLGARVFDVMIIPFTWEQTNLRALRAGDPVNLECDVLGKYVARIAELSGWSPARPN